MYLFLRNAREACYMGNSLKVIKVDRTLSEFIF